MMLKERTNRWARLKLLFVVPAMAGAIYAFAQPEVKENLVMTTEGSTPQSYEQPQKDKLIKGVEVTFFDAEGTTKKALKNFTLKQLKKELSSFQSSSKSPKTLTVGLKVKKDCPIETVSEVKQALRSAYALKVNYKEEK